MSVCDIGMGERGDPEPLSTVKEKKGAKGKSLPGRRLKQEKKTKRYRTYDKTCMERAVKLIQEKSWSFRKSAKLCGVPYTSLHDAISRNKHDGVQGTPPIIPIADEILLMKHGVRGDPAPLSVKRKKGDKGKKKNKGKSPLGTIGKQGKKVVLPHIPTHTSSLDDADENTCPQPPLPSSPYPNRPTAQANESSANNQPVEFNHADNYINKVKNHFQGQPESYKAFLEILHTYLKERMSVKESPGIHNPTICETQMFDQVAELFKNQEDLLQELSQFLPHVSGSTAVTNGVRSDPGPPSTVQGEKRAKGKKRAQGESTPGPKGMPEKKTKRYQTYDKTCMERAVKLTREKKWSIRKSATLCGVPYTSLHDIISGRSKQGGVQGAPPIIPIAHEKLLMEHASYMTAIGYPLSRSAFLKLATDTAMLLGLKNQFGNRRRLLSNSWFYGFMHRWPELQLAKPQKLSKIMVTPATETVENNYFKELEDILNKHSLMDKPWFIFNVDETGPSGLQPNMIATETGPLTTVLAAGSAAGYIMPPYCVFKGNHLMDELKDGAYPGSTFAITDSGWSDQKIFEDFLCNHFLKFVPNRDPEQHVLLVYDGHTSHISLPLINFARQHQIILFALPAHTSHVLEPLDVAVFKPLRTYYCSECQNFMRTNPGQVITGYDICKLVLQAYSKAMTPNNLIAFFRQTGIFPLNREIL